MANYAPLIARLELMPADTRYDILEWQRIQEECGFECASHIKLKEKLHARKRKKDASTIPGSPGAEPSGT